MRVVGMCLCAAKILSRNTAATEKLPALCNQRGCACALRGMM